MTLWWTLLETASSSLRSGDILSAYLHLQTGSYTTVGYAQGIIGASQLAAAVPSGIVADRLRRDVVLRVSAGVGAAAAALMAAALLWRLPMWALYCGAALLGAYAGANSPPLESLFAESLRRGSRRVGWACVRAGVHLCGVCRAFRRSQNTRAIFRG